MHIISKMTSLALLAALAGCAGMLREQPTIGDPLATVTTKFGQPTAIYPASPGQVLEYATGPFGQATYMARIGADGRLTAFEQVLTGEKFATLKIGAANKTDVLLTLVGTLAGGGELTFLGVGRIILVAFGFVTQ